MRKTMNRLLRRLSYKAFCLIDRTITHKQRVAFIHVPKCAGKSVAAAIHNSMGSLLEPWINSRDARLAVRSVLPDASPLEIVEATPLYRQYLLSYLLRSGRKLIYGHLPVNKTLVEEYKNEVAFVTVLRDPVARWKSHYAYDKINNNDAMLLPVCNAGICLEEELDRVLDSARGRQFAFFSTMMLTGKFPSDLREAEILSRLAIETIKSFAVVGFTEDLTSFAEDFERVIGLKIHISRKNITAPQSFSDDASLYNRVLELLNLPKTTQRIAKTM